MKKIILAVMILVGLWLVFVLGLRIYLDRSPGRDHYHYLDESERYELIDSSGIHLFDKELGGMSITSDIHKYAQKNGYIYIIENANFSTGGNENTTYYYDRDITSGEMIAYTDPSEIPIYIVLNYETGEATKYMSLEEMPEDVRAIFEEPVTEECLKDRSCYEETEN